MPTERQNKAATLYSDIMEEVKVRLSCIQDGIGGRTNLPSPAVREFCYLQLRFICECVALGCLVVHGDIEEVQTSRLQSADKADFIINRLEQIHADFYPKPISITFPEPMRQHHDLIETGYLTKEELISLFRECGGKLHKGSVRKLIKANSPFETRYEDIRDWNNKVVTLLNTHRLHLFDERTLYVCVLKAPQVGDRVLTAIAEAPPANPA